MLGNNKKISLIHKLAWKWKYAWKVEPCGDQRGHGFLYFYTTFCNMSVVKATLIFSLQPIWM